MFSKNAIDLINIRYKHSNESVEGVFKRVAKAISVRDEKFEKELFNLMTTGVFFPNSPCLRNAGRKRGMLHACMTKDSIIHTAKGDLSVEQLLGGEETIYVFSCTGEKVVMGKATRPVLTREGADVFKVKFDNGGSIKLTEDHLVMLRDGSFRQVKDLEEGDSLMPFNYRYKNDYRYIQKEISKHEIPAYLVAWQFKEGRSVEKGCLIHHKDLDRGNDAPDNLDIQVPNAIGTLNPMYGIHRFGKDNPNYKHGRSCRNLNNHKVISIEYIGKEDVYDIELVEKYHNFAVNGIFIHNCFVLPCEDSMTDIFETVKNMATIFKFGGGVGINFSKLRPMGALLSSGGTSSGAISFMGIFDAITETVKQGGFRRGALMGILNPDHPEILSFCRAKLKGNLTNFNLSVMVSDQFMKKAVGHGSIDLVYNEQVFNTIRAGDVLDLVSLGTWANGDPGMLFYDRINKDNPLKAKGIMIDCTNPCSEVALPPYGACCLGSINLSKFVEGNNFDFDRFEGVVRSAARALANMNVIGHFPLPLITRFMSDHNPIGVGLMGFADTLIMLGIKYDSEACIDFIKKMAVPYKSGSEAVAPEAFYKRIIAPTGSLSILGDCSFGIEPVFAAEYDRHISIGVFHEGKELYKSEHCQTAYEVSPDGHLKVQAAFQEIVDGGVSKTINVPNNTSVDEIKKIYIKAWKSKVKGVTVFRDGSIEGVLRAKTKCEGEVCSL